MIRCAIYARYSSDLQSVTSIEDQVRLCRAHAERQGWLVVETFADAALSGASANRPGYQELIAALLATPGAFDVVLVEDLSRLTRDTAELLRLHQRLQLRGVEIIGVVDGVRSNAQGATVHLTVKGLTNALFLEDLSAKTHRGLAGAVERGLSTGGACFGYRTVKVDGVGDAQSKHAAPARIEVDDREAVIVRRIFKDYIAGRSPREIADALNREGVACPGQRRKRGALRRGWASSTLHVVLANEKYIGVWLWNRTKFLKEPVTGQRRAVARPPNEWVRRSRPELAILAAETWRAAQQRAAEVREAFGIAPGGRPVGRASRAYSPRLLSGLVVCGVCGANLVGQTTRRVKAERVYSYSTYRCGAAATKGSSVCTHGTSYRGDRLETALIDRFRVATSPVMVEALAAMVNAGLRTALGRRDETAQRLKGEITDLERKVGHVVAFIAGGGQTPTLRDELVTMEGALLALRGELTKGDAAGRAPVVDPAWVQAHIDRLMGLLKGDPMRAKTEIARHLDGPLMLKPLPAPHGERRAAISGAFRADGLLGQSGLTGRPVAHSAGCGGWI